MKTYLKSVISTLLAIVIFSVTGLSYSDASSSSTQLTKGHVIIINTKTNKLGYFKDGNIVKTFNIATGKPSTPTPTGKTKIVNKIKNRPYYKGGIPGGDPRNPLGDRWLGLHLRGTYGTTYGIHGNNNESSIGKFVSGGCIRMHNSEVRWLFDRVPVGTTVIIEKSSQTFVEIAAKYNVKLYNKNEITTNMKTVESKFKQFYIYGPSNNPIIDLSNKNQLITKSSYATNILKKTIDGKKYDRQIYLDAWNKLNSTEKSHSNMVKINKEYNKIISVTEAAEADLKFYENVKKNANTLIQNNSKAASLNSKDNMEMGARGKAYKEYEEAKAYGENSSNSPRMKYINEKYLDTVRFLNVAKYIGDNDLTKAKAEIAKIKDSTLNKIANEEVNKTK